jgi:hypothetical protein
LKISYGVLRRSWKWKASVSSWEQETKCAVRCIVKCRVLD